MDFRLRIFLLLGFVYGGTCLAARVSKGDLVCGSTMESCPGLVTALLPGRSGNGDSVAQVIGSFSLRDTIPAAALESWGPAEIPFLKKKETRGAWDIDYSGNCNEVMEKESYSNLGFSWTGPDDVDSTYCFDHENFLKNIPPCTSAWRGCLDGYRGFGLVHAPFLPDLRLDISLEGYWMLPESLSYRPAWKSWKAHIGEAKVFFQEKPSLPGQPRFFEKSNGFWIFDYRGRSVGVEPVARAEDYSENFFLVRDVRFEPVYPSRWPLAAVVTERYYNHGSYRELFLLSFDAKAERLISRVVKLGGADGESGGSQTAGEWWITLGAHKSLPRLYVARTQMGNETGASRDLAAEAYDFLPDGSIKKVASKRFFAVCFGSPSEKRKTADSLAETLKAANKTARDAGLRALPVLSDGRPQWIVGAIAPDKRTAQEWSRWDKSGHMRILPSILPHP